MKRRSFLKLLGFGAVAPLALLSPRRVKAAKRGVNKPLEMAKAIADPNLNYRLVVVDMEGRRRWAPKTKRVAHTYTGVVFYAEDVNVTEHGLTIWGCEIMNPEGKIFAMKPFPAPIPLGYGDVLKLNYKLNVGEIQ
jgi:hypothetical protein